MRRIDTSVITVSNGMPLKSGTLDFFFDSHQEDLKDTIIGMIGTTYSSTTLYSLFGCKITPSVTANLWDITQGAIFYGGKVYKMPTTSFVIDTVGGIGVDVIISQSQYTTDADPVQMTGGGLPIDVHNIYDIQFTANGAASIGSLYFSLSTPPNVIPVNTGDWIDPTFTGTYIAHGSNPIQYRQVGRRVYLKGRVSNSAPGTATGDSPVFTIAETWMRPSTERFFIVTDVSTVSKTAHVSVKTTGVVSIRGDYGTPTNTGVMFDQVSFDI